MIDMPQIPPPAYEQGLTQELLQCGLQNGGFAVKYAEELQGVEVVIHKEAGASPEHFDCIRQAAGSKFVTFENPELQQAYVDQSSEALRPTVLADARAELEKHGVFDGFPERSELNSDKLFAEALERKCGIKPGSFFFQNQLGLIGQPEVSRHSKDYGEQMSCLIAAITYADAKGDDFKFGFIGNEAFGVIGNESAAPDE
jgi:hypothetical protein|tara:strand:+ start:1287 stop:1886 length:600 start_codon:yes stop_codon:yes gene_type:complete